MAQPQNNGDSAPAPVRKSTPIKKAAFLEALKVHYGTITKAANEVGIKRDTHYLWMRTDPEYAKAYKEVMEGQLDHAEHCLLDMMKDNVTACIFFLKNKGQSRGYFPDAYHVIHGTSSSGQVVMAPPTVVFQQPANYHPTEDLQDSQSASV